MADGPVFTHARWPPPSRWKLAGSRARDLRIVLGVGRFALRSGAKRAIAVVLSRHGYDVLIRAGRLSAEARASYVQAPA